MIAGPLCTLYILEAGINEEKKWRARFFFFFSMLQKRNIQHMVKDRRQKNIVGSNKANFDVQE